MVILCMPLLYAQVDEVVVIREQPVMSFRSLGVQQDIAPSTVMEVIQTDNIEKTLAELRNDPSVKVAGPNYIYTTMYNDPFLDSASANYQWFHTTIHSFDAWDITTGSNEVIIAVIDTGVNTNHPEFEGRIHSTWNVVTNTQDITDTSYHGTHVAGLVGANFNNSQGGSGVCPNCSLMLINAFFFNGTHYVSNTLHVRNAITYAAQQGAHIISMSLGGTILDEVLEDIVNDATHKGHILVAAAGNNNTNQMAYPAGFDNVIAVGSTTQADTRSGFSNYGSWVDVAAPGTNIWSTFPYAPPNNYYALDGTSMATPLVSGALGLYLSVYGNVFNESRTNMTRLRWFLDDTSDIINIDENKPIGKRLNVFNMLQFNATPTFNYSFSHNFSQDSLSILFNVTSNCHIFNYNVYYRIANTWDLLTSGSTNRYINYTFVHENTYDVYAIFTCGSTEYITSEYTIFFLENPNIQSFTQATAVDGVRIIYHNNTEYLLFTTFNNTHATMYLKDKDMQDISGWPQHIPSGSQAAIYDGTHIHITNNTHLLTYALNGTLINSTQQDITFLQGYPIPNTYSFAVNNDGIYVNTTRQMNISTNFTTPIAWSIYNQDVIAAFSYYNNSIYHHRVQAQDILFNWSTDTDVLQHWFVAHNATLYVISRYKNATEVRNMTGDIVDMAIDNVITNYSITYGNNVFSYNTTDIYVNNVRIPVSHVEHINTQGDVQTIHNIHPLFVFGNTLYMFNRNDTISLLSWNISGVYPYDIVFAPTQQDPYTSRFMKTSNYPLLYGLTHNTTSFFYVVDVDTVSNITLEQFPYGKITSVQPLVMSNVSTHRDINFSSTNIAHTFTTPINITWYQWNYQNATIYNHTTKYGSGYATEHGVRAQVNGSGNFTPVPFPFFSINLDQQQIITSRRRILQVQSPTITPMHLTYVTQHQSLCAACNVSTLPFFLRLGVHNITLQGQYEHIPITYNITMNISLNTTNLLDTSMRGIPETNKQDIIIQLDNTTYDNTTIIGKRNVTIRAQQQPLLTFAHNFSQTNITLLKLYINQSIYNNRSFIHIDSEFAIANKTVFLPRNNINFSHICVVDAKLFDVTTISTPCNGTSELRMLCPSTLGNYTCSEYNASVWQISGLQYSAVSETCSESWQTSDWGTCSNGQQARTVTDLHACGTEFDKPITTRACTSGNDNNNGGGGGSPGSPSSAPLGTPIAQSTSDYTPITLFAHTPQQFTYRTWYTLTINQQQYNVIFYYENQSVVMRHGTNTYLFEDNQLLFFNYLLRLSEVSEQHFNLLWYVQNPTEPTQEQNQTTPIQTHTPYATQQDNNFIISQQPIIYLVIGFIILFFLLALLYYYKHHRHRYRLWRYLK